jgi:hypothetical protein
MVLVIGDLNAGVGEVNEFVPPYDFLKVDPQVNNEVIQEDYDFAPAPIRRNRDRKVNSSGRKCLLYRFTVYFATPEVCREPRSPTPKLPKSRDSTEGCLPY